MMCACYDDDRGGKDWEAERKALLLKKEELMGKAEEGHVLSQLDEEALSTIEAEIQALKVQQTTLPKEVR